MRSCFLPNCDANNKDWKGRPMFAAPKDPDSFARWKEALPKKREFKSTDKVCLIHFNESDLITTYDTIVNGELVVIPRGRPRLNETAVPCKNLSNCDYPRRGRKCGKKNIDKTEIVLKKVVLKRVKVKKNGNSNGETAKFQNESLKEIKNENDSANLVEEYFNKFCEEEGLKKKIDANTKKNYTINEEAENNCKSNKTKYESYSINEKKEHEKKLNQIEPSDEQKEIFNSLFEDIFEIELPSTLWAIHRDPSFKFIALTYFDPKLYLTSKSLILNNNLRANVVIFDKYLQDENLNDRCSIEDIGNVLREVDNIRLCSSNKQLNGLCQLKLDENDISLCKSCLPK